MTGLRHGPLSAPLHLVVDMQPLFGPAGPWAVPGIDALLPACARLLTHAPDAAAFARFLPADHPEAAPGQWRTYYRRWSEVTRASLAPELLPVMPELRRLAPAAPVIDKTGYSAFDPPDLATLLTIRGTETLVLSGVETDVCVLATALAAVDRGLRVVLAADAVTSAEPAMHAAALAILAGRFDLQVEIAPVAEILAHWPTPGTPTPGTTDRA